MVAAVNEVSDALIVFVSGLDSFCIDEIAYLCGFVAVVGGECNVEDIVFCAVGSDMLMSFDKWYRFEDILGEVTLCASTRSGDDLGELRRKAYDLGRYGRVIVTGSCPIVVSSTEIRKKIAKNEDFTCYLNENVVQYIRLRKLYT